MKKILSLTALVLALGAMPLLSQAEEACVPSDSPISGCVIADEGSQSLTVDGNASNQDPLDGYVRVDSEGNCYAEDQGSYDVAEENEEVADNQTCQEAVESNLP